MKKLYTIKNIRNRDLNYIFYVDFMGLFFEVFEIWFYFLDFVYGIMSRFYLIFYLVT